MTLDTAGSASARSTRIARCRCRLPCPPGQRWTLAPGSAAARAEKAKARVEHPFRIIKRVFGCDMVRYRGLDKNVQRLALLPGFSNLMIARPHLS